jgi:hypothetical protein
MSDTEDMEIEETRPEGVPDLTDPVAQRETRKNIKLAEKERTEALRTLLSTKQGRKLYSYIMHDLSGLYRPVANMAFCPNALHFREGQRAVGQVLHDLALQEAKQSYILLLSENLSNS